MNFIDEDEVEKSPDNEESENTEHVDDYSKEEKEKEKGLIDSLGFSNTSANSLANMKKKEKKKKDGFSFI